MFIIFDENGTQLLITTIEPVLKENWVSFYKPDAKQDHYYSLVSGEIIDNGVLELQPPEEE